MRFDGTRKTHQAKPQVDHAHQPRTAQQVQPQRATPQIIKVDWGAELIADAIIRTAWIVTIVPALSGGLLLGIVYFSTLGAIKNAIEEPTTSTSGSAEYRATMDELDRVEENIRRMQDEFPRNRSTLPLQSVDAN